MEINKNNGLSDFVDNDTFNFNEVSNTAQVEFEFPFKKDKDVIHYIDNGCGCTKAWFEDGKIKGILSIDKAGQFQAGINPVNKIVTVMLDPQIQYITGGDKKEKIIDQNKRYFRLTLVGRVSV